MTKFLKLKPELWAGVASCLIEQGIWGENTKLKEVLHTLSRTMTQKKNQHSHTHKQGRKIPGKDEGNTTLPLEMASIVSIAILDSGAGISIATKSMWEKWGKPIVQSTRMNLQLADGSLEQPIGVLENVTVKSLWH